MTTAAQKAALNAAADLAVAKATATFAAIAALPVDDPPASDPEWTARTVGALWARRLLAPGPDDVNITARHRPAPNTPLVGLWVPQLPAEQGGGDDPRITLPVIDARGLRFDIETGKGQSDFYFALPKEFGADSYFAMQWTQIFNRAFIYTVFQMAGGGYPGIKLAIINTLAASSTWPKLVVSTLDQHKFPFLYQYDQNGATANLQRNVGNPPVDFDWQPKEGVAPACLYSVNNATQRDLGPGAPTPGCNGLDAEVEITFTLQCRTFGLIPGTNTWHCDRRLYMQRGKGAPHELVVHYDSRQGGIGRNAEPWTGVWLNPYMTNRDGAQVFASVPSVWYRDVIIRDAPFIADEAPAPIPAVESADGTKIPPATQIVDSAGVTWSLSGGHAVRDGVVMSWGALLALKYVAKTVYAQGDSGAWYEVRGTSLMAYGPNEPGATAPPPVAAQTIDEFSVSKTVLVTGESAALAWQTTGATAVRLDGVAVAPDGSQTITPASSRSFVLEVDGAGPTITRSVSVTVAAVPAPSDGTLPSFVPPPGTFAEFTTNTPASVGAPVSTLANWTGGAFVEDYGDAGGQAIHGGGEHFSWNDPGGVLMLDCAARTYAMRCLSGVLTHMGVAGTAGSPVDDFGCYVDNGFPQTKHSYNGIVGVPAGWGGVGAKGGLLRIQSGGPLNAAVPMVDMQGRPVMRADGTQAMRTHGWTAGHLFDLEHDVDGYRRVTGDQRIDLGSGSPSTINDAPGVCFDTLRNGAWVFARTGSGAGDKMGFIAADGTVTSPSTQAIGVAWGRLHHFADDDTLAVIAGGAPGVIAICHPGSTWKVVPITGTVEDVAQFQKMYLGYVGFQWSELLQCLVGIDVYGRVPNEVGVWKVIPPAGSARWSQPWRVEREVVASADGSVIDMATDHAVNAGNGLSYGKLVECRKLRALVWTRRIDKPGQLIRLKGM